MQYQDCIAKKVAYGFQYICAFSLNQGEWKKNIYV